MTHSKPADDLLLQTVIHQDAANLLIHAIESGLSPNYPLNYYTSPLVMACMREAYFCTQALINARADIFVTDEFGNNIIHNISCFNDRKMLEFVEYFVEQGVSLNAQNHVGSSPLHSAAVSDDLNKAILLLDMGADPNAENAEMTTPIFETTNQHIVKLMIAHGADPNHKNAYGENPLHHCPSYECVKALVESGADVNALNKEGASPLLTMIDLGSQDSCDAAIYLIKHGAEMNTNLIDPNIAHANDYFDTIMSCYELSQSEKQQEHLINEIRKEIEQAHVRARKL